MGVSYKAGVQTGYGYEDTDDNDRYLSTFDTLNNKYFNTSVAVADVVSSIVEFFC